MIKKNKMEDSVSRKDRAILMQHEKRSKDLVDMAMKYSWNQFILSNALCSQHECYSSPDHIIYPDFLPIYAQADSEHVKRIQQKDNTSALKLWLLQHKKTPYPSKAEKIMLAILAKMTMTQVSTWFANARRRLKKDYPDID